METKNIDRQIAEKVMGWRFIRGFGNTTAINNHFVYQKPCDTMIQVPRDFSPSTNIAHAFEVVEKMNKLGFTGGVYQISEMAQIRHGGEWLGYFTEQEVIADIQSIADTPAMAICLAALEATNEK